MRLGLLVLYVSDLERAHQFYGEILGLPLVQEQHCRRRNERKVVHARRSPRHLGEGFRRHCWGGSHPNRQVELLFR